MRFRPKKPCCAFLDRIVTAKETSADTKGELHSKRRSYLGQNSRFHPVLDSSVMPWRARAPYYLCLHTVYWRSVCEDTRMSRENANTAIRIVPMVGLEHKRPPLPRHPPPPTGLAYMNGPLIC